MALDDVAPAGFVERLAMCREKRLCLPDHLRGDGAAQILLDEHLKAEEQRAVIAAAARLDV
jgi:hypothetical protein